MAASNRKSGITARDLLRHPAYPAVVDETGTALPGPIHASTPVEVILELLRTGEIDTIDVVDDQGRLEGTITREGALRSISRAIEDLTEERRVLQLAVERQRAALEEATGRLGRIRDAVELAEELRRGSAGAATKGLEHALEEIRRVLFEPRRG